MAKLVTFANGATVSAADLNSIVPTVPNAGDVLDTAWVTTGFTPGAGAASIGTTAIRRIGNIVQVVINTIVVSTALTATVNGDVPNTVVANVPSAFIPSRDGVLSTYGSGALAAFLINSSGQIMLTAVSPSATWTGSTAWTGTVSCGGIYFLG